MLLFEWYANYLSSPLLLARITSIRKCSARILKWRKIWQSNSKICSFSAPFFCLSFTCSLFSLSEKRNKNEEKKKSKMKIILASKSSLCYRSASDIFARCIKLLYEFDRFLWRFRQSAHKRRCCRMSPNFSTFRGCVPASSIVIKWNANFPIYFFYRVTNFQRAIKIKSLFKCNRICFALKYWKKKCCAFAQSTAQRKWHKDKSFIMTCSQSKIEFATRKCVSAGINGHATNLESLKWINAGKSQTGYFEMCFSEWQTISTNVQVTALNNLFLANWFRGLTTILDNKDFRPNKKVVLWKQRSKVQPQNNDNCCWLITNVTLIWNVIKSTRLLSHCKSNKSKWNRDSQ